MSRVNNPSDRLVNEWDTLLTEFTRLSCTEVGSEPSGFETLLTGFVEAEKLVRAREVAEAKEDEANFGRLLEGYDDVFRRWRERQVTVAEDFSLVDLLGLVRDENRHSDVLAWLLDADVYRATHSQGNRGFSAFLVDHGMRGGALFGDVPPGLRIMHSCSGTQQNAPLVQTAFARHESP